MEDVGDEIREYTERAGKNYAFNGTHDERVPAQMWFQESDEGLFLFIVFYTLACRWSRCLGCCLPSKMSLAPVSYKALMAQVDAVFFDPAVLDRSASIRKVILSNNGSVLDQVTFSSTALMYLLARVNLHVPNLDVLTIETRPEYVEMAELEFIARALAEGETRTQLEIAIGFEVFDDRIRNEVYHKGLEKSTFEQLARDVAPYGYRLKCYFMQKPVPGMTDGEAIADIQNGIDYLSHVAAERRIAINMHLCPTYVASGTMLEDAFRKGQYAPPRLQDVARAALHARGKNVSIYIGTFDEGLAVEGGSFVRPGDAVSVAELERFNRTQDFDILRAVCA
jgi:radical SAM enzyme (TIGR01210 family)